MKKSLSYSELVQGKTADYAKVGKVSAESVQKHTGKDWEQWVDVLDRAGARAWKYGEIVAYLGKKHRLGPWWRHGVAMGFEIAIGRRLEGQDAKGKYIVTTTKSLAVGGREVWRWLVGEEGQAAWLRPLAPLTIRPKTPFETEDGFFGEVRTMLVGRRLRLSWQDPRWTSCTFVELGVFARPGKKTILAFTHSGLPDLRARDAVRGRWKAAVETIAKRFAKTVG